MIKHIFISAFLVMLCMGAKGQQIDSCDLVRAVFSDSVVVHEILFNKEGMNPIIVKQKKRPSRQCLGADTLGRRIEYQSTLADYPDGKKDGKANGSVLYISDLADVKNGEKKVRVSDPNTNTVVELYFKVIEGKLCFVRREFRHI